MRPTPPLAERMRPSSLATFVGQSHLIKPGAVLWNVLQQQQVPSMIFWGPPGVGKTTLAHIIAQQVKVPFVKLSAISAGVKEVREVIKRASFKTIVFIDEIHRFSKSQQDALLGAVERGSIKLIGATTENPSFEVNAALLSRCQAYQLKALEAEDLKALLALAMEKDPLLQTMDIQVKEYDALLRLSGGDARRLLNLFELVLEQHPEGPKVVDNKTVQTVAQQNPLRYDKDGDMHYDIISAFIKSIRGSDPNAAVYWLARMIEGGEDAKFIARRLVILASEDIGNANPTALVMAQTCYQSVSVIGYPEARIILSQTCTYLAASPKSNAAYKAINQAQREVQQSGDLEVPLTLRGAYTSFNKNLGHGKDYQYPHDHNPPFVDQEYLPDQLSGTTFYAPGDNSREAALRQQLKGLWKKKYKY